MLAEGWPGWRLGFSSIQCLSFLLCLQPCGNWSILGNGNSPFFFICRVERLSCPGDAVTAADPPGWPELTHSVVPESILGCGCTAPWAQGWSREETLA